MSMTMRIFNSTEVALQTHRSAKQRRERLGDIFTLEIGIEAQDDLLGVARGDQPDYGFHRHTIPRMQGLTPII
jgi:hypothetical protein